MDKEDQHVIVAFPGEKYIDHLSPVKSKATDIAKEIGKIVISTESTITLKAALCYSTAVNTGKA